MQEPRTARVAATVLGVSGATTALPAGVLLLSGFASPRNWLYFVPVAATGAAYVWTAQGVLRGRRREWLAAIVLVILVTAAVDVDVVVQGRSPLTAAVCSAAALVVLACLASSSYRSWSRLVTVLGPVGGAPGEGLSPRRRAGGARGRGGSSGRTTRP